MHLDHLQDTWSAPAISSANKEKYKTSQTFSSDLKCLNISFQAISIKTIKFNRLCRDFLRPNFDKPGHASYSPIKSQAKFLLLLNIYLQERENQHDTSITSEDSKN